MNKEIFWAGAFMQIIHVFVLIALFVPWTIDLFVKIVLGTLYGLFNIASIILIIVGLASKKKDDAN